MRLNISPLTATSASWKVMARAAEDIWNRLPKTAKHGNFDGVVRPMIEMDDVLAHALVPLLDARVVLYQHFLELDRRVKRAASHCEVCMRLMTVPGVGPIAALTFKGAVDDPTRFQRSRTVGALFGLTPRRYQ
jgi:transposase